MTNRTDNQHFGGINKRFDKRAKLLRKIGFHYERSEEYGTAFFVLGKSDYDRKKRSIPSAAVSHADNRSFFMILRSVC